MVTRARPLRADAARNRGRLVAAASELFAARGLDVPLDHVARHAGVSIGTLYAHFPDRQSVFDAVLPERLQAVDDLGAKALRARSAWQGFADYVRGVLALQEADRGLNDALAQRFPVSPLITDACERGAQTAMRIMDKAHAAGQLRDDFGPAELSTLIRAVSGLIRDSTPERPIDWRTFLEQVLDGLAVGSAASSTRRAGSARRRTATRGRR